MFFGFRFSNDASTIEQSGAVYGARQTEKEDQAGGVGERSKKKIEREEKEKEEDGVDDPLPPLPAVNNASDGGRGPPNASPSSSSSTPGKRRGLSRFSNLHSHFVRLVTHCVFLLNFFFFTPNASHIENN